MRFLLDTNVVVYALHQETKQHAKVNEFMTCALRCSATCYFLSSSLKDVYYILCRHYLSENDARTSIKMLRETLDMVDLSSTFIDEALQSDEPDFEDGIVRAAAESLHVDAVVSYDESAFKHSFIPKMTAEKALLMMGGVSSQEKTNL